MSYQKHNVQVLFDSMSEIIYIFIIIFFIFRIEYQVEYVRYEVLYKMLIVSEKYFVDNGKKY